MTMMLSAGATVSSRSNLCVAHSNKSPHRRIIGPVRFKEREKAQEVESIEQKVESRIAEAGESVVSQVQGFLSNPNTQAQGYWYLGTAALTTGLMCLIAPGPVASFMLHGAVDPVVNTLVRAAGATLLTSAAVKYTLKEASVRSQLHLDTFRRLNLGLMLQTATALVIAAQAISLRNNMLTGYMALVCAPGLVIASRLYALYKQGGGLPLPSPSKTFTGMVGVLLPRNLSATVYSLLTLAFTGLAALSLSAAPGEPMLLYQGLHGPMTVFAERCAGAGLVLMALVAYSLKDGADRGKLGATTFRWLNLGLAGSLLSTVWYFTNDYQTGLLMHSAKSMAMMAAIIGSFMFTGFMYVAGSNAPKA